MGQQDESKSSVNNTLPQQLKVPSWLDWNTQAATRSQVKFIKRVQATPVLGPPNIDALSLSSSDVSPNLAAMECGEDLLRVRR
jgi:hypothetical protein